MRTNRVQSSLKFILNGLNHKEFVLCFLISSYSLKNRWIPFEIDPKAAFFKNFSSYAHEKVGYLTFSKAEDQEGGVDSEQEKENIRAARSKATQEEKEEKEKNEEKENEKDEKNDEDDDDDNKGGGILIPVIRWIGGLIPRLVGAPKSNN